MTNKLTKNDSMRNDAQDFKVIVAAFEATLSKNRVHLDYFANWSKRRVLNYGDTLYTQWLKWASKTATSKWIIRAFVYEETNIPVIVWLNLDLKWQEWLNQNLNK